MYLNIEEITRKSGYTTASFDMPTVGTVSHGTLTPKHSLANNEILACN
jgi:hypothetical protein